MNLINSSSHFPGDQIININDHDHNFALSHHQLVNSSSSSSSRIFLIDSTQDHNGYYHHQYFYQPHYQEDEKYAYHHGGSPYEMIKKNTVNNNSLNLTLRPKKEDDHVTQSHEDKDMINPVKWLSSSSKIRLTTKSKNIKNPNFPALESSSSLETDLSSNPSSYNSPIRVCADCNTTKTPLWRSGPKGPKSLCNACGIRQRKARRAMAAATAAPTGVVVAAPDPPPPAVKKIKVVQHKEKKQGQNGHSAFKRRFKGLSSSSSSSSSSNRATSKVGLEEFLINLSNNLSLQRVFPEDEKDAAILLMALSSGLVHG